MNAFTEGNAEFSLFPATSGPKGKGGRFRQTFRSGRRVTDGLVKEVTVPLNLTMDELRQHRKLRLKITLDVNLLG